MGDYEGLILQLSELESERRGSELRNEQAKTQLSHATLELRNATEKIDALKATLKTAQAKAAAAEAEKEGLQNTIKTLKESSDDARGHVVMLKEQIAKGKEEFDKDRQEMLDSLKRYDASLNAVEQYFEEKGLTRPFLLVRNPESTDYESENLRLRLELSKLEEELQRARLHVIQGEDGAKLPDATTKRPKEEKEDDDNGISDKIAALETQLEQSQTHERQLESAQAEWIEYSEEVDQALSLKKCPQCHKTLLEVLKPESDMSKTAGEAMFPVVPGRTEAAALLEERKRKKTDYSFQLHSRKRVKKPI